LIAGRGDRPEPHRELRSSRVADGVSFAATDLVTDEKAGGMRGSWPWWRWALTGLSALALMLSGYLGWHYLTGASMIGCSVESSCDHVLNSRWSLVAGGLPVSGLAAGTYLALLLASVFIGPATAPPIRRLAWRTMLILAGAIAGSAVWFIILQRWAMGAFCRYCMATHVTGLAIAVLVIWQALRLFEDDAANAPVNFVPSGGTHATIAENISSAGQRRHIGTLSAIGPALAGLALAGMMAASQVLFPPASVYRGGESQNNLPAIDPHVSPLIGSPDALYIVNLLFDYKCPHCQRVHVMLDEVVRRYGGKVAFALCPTPLNTQCNAYVPRDVDEFADSCELAKVGLAVWVAKRDAFPAFDRWMYSFESGDRWHPRSLAAARAEAAELVGQAEFNSALADPWIDRYLQTSIRIYGKTVQGGNTAIPKLVFGSHWVIPEPNDVGDLVSILHDSLALPSP